VDDTTDLARATKLIQSIAGGPRPAVGGIKLGLEFFLAHGAPGVRYAFPAPVRATGVGFFLDLKLHDIPNTVGRAVEGARSLGVEMLTLHLCGGSAMVKAAVAAAPPELLLLGVTVLTSSDDATLREIGVASAMEEQVLRLAKFGVDAGIGGVVASPREISALRSAHGSKIKIVTPGIRPVGAATQDQRRVLSPGEAIKAGADFLVIGRPITAATDARRALDQIVADAV